MAYHVQPPPILAERVARLLLKRRAEHASLPQTKADIAEAETIRKTKGIAAANTFLQGLNAVSRSTRPSTETVVLELIEAGLNALGE